MKPWSPPVMSLNISVLAPLLERLEDAEAFELRLYKDGSGFVGVRAIGTLGTFHKPYELFYGEAELHEALRNL